MYITAMRKVWTTSRNGIYGVYVEWYDAPKRRRSKYFAPHYRKLAKRTQALLESDLSGIQT